MARKTVYVPDDLLAQVGEHRPDLNVSRLLQEALRAVLAGTCEHRRLTCSDCGSDVTRGEVSGAFYRELLHELGPVVDRGSPAVGAARVAQRVAVDFGVPDAEHAHLPRPPRTARETNR